jgi:uncharacterized membrane protein
MMSLPDQAPASDTHRPLPTESRVLMHVVYGLHTLAWATMGTLALIALIINYIRRSDDPNPLHREHHRYMIGTFWWSLLWLLLVSPLFLLFLLPGFLAYAAVGIWYLYRSLKGWMRFADHRFPHTAVLPGADSTPSSDFSKTP